MPSDLSFAGLMTARERARGSSAPSFDPTSVSTLLAGFSTRLSALFQVSDGTTPATAGNDPVAYASDLSGNARHFRQPDNTGHRPLLILNQINGFSSLRFDGSDDVIYNNNWSRVQPFTLFLVCKQITWSSGDRITSGGDNTDRAIIGQYTATPQIGLFNGGSVVANNSDFVVGAWAILEAVFNGASSELQVNGGTASTGDVGADSLTDGWAIGGKSAPGSGQQTNIDVAEALIYDDLSAGERTTVRQGLASVYGITLS